MTKKLSQCFDFPTHTTKVNKLWHKCSKGTTRTDRRKSNTYSLPTMQNPSGVPITDKQTNKQTDSGSTEWQ